MLGLPMKIEIDQHILTTVNTVMLRHVGSANRISYDELTTMMYGKPTDNNRRKLRAVISAINGDPSNGVVICSDREDGGLFMNGHTDDDKARHLNFYFQERAQALTTLEKLAAMEHKLSQMYGSELLRPIDTAQGRLF